MVPNFTKESGRITEHDIKKKIKLDLKDKKIIALLSEDARMPLAHIGKQVNLSGDAVDYRIKRLVDHGLIIGFIPVLMLNRFGYYWFHVYMVLDETKKETQHKLIAALKKHPNIRSVMEYSDRWDIEFVLIAENAVEFDKITTEITNNFSEVISEKNKLEVVKYYKSIHIPQIFFDNLFPNSYEITKLGYTDLSDITPKPSYKLDNKDIHIISALSKNARISSYKIAEQINLSADAVSYRIKKMMAEGFVDKFTLILNLSMIEFEWHTFAIQIKTLDPKSEKRFREFINSNPYIIRCVKVLGRWDLLLSIVTDTSASFHKTIKEIKTRFASIINTYETWTAYKEHTYNHFPSILERKYKKKKVLCFGTFDVLHPGHLQFFKDAKKYGDHLTVVVSRDVTVKIIKKSKPKYEEKDRLEHVKRIDIVDTAILGNKTNKFQIIKDIQPDIICLGYDQTSFTDHLKQELDKLNITADIVRMKPYKEHKYKSSKLKNND
jgi:FAD synthetase